MREVAKAVALDLWICDHYRVLPTEDRYKNLTDRQKYLLFLGFVDQPTDEHMHKSYQASKTNYLGSNDKKNLMNLGYTQDQLRHIQEQLEKAQADG